MLFSLLGVSRRPKIFHACRDNQNFGDALAPIIFKHMTGVTPVVSDAAFLDHSPILFGIGSIIHHIRFPNRAIVWGSGIIESSSKCQRPRRVCAVRGPYTAGRLVELGFERSTNYGDPGLMVPELFPNISEPRSGIGIVPHFVDYESANNLYSAFDDVEIINVLEPCESVALSIQSKELIFSSSLHGLIVAHSYGIPAMWVKISNNLKGDNIKFVDYFHGIDQNINVEEFATDSDSVLRYLKTRRGLAITYPDVSNAIMALKQSFPEEYRESI